VFTSPQIAAGGNGALFGSLAPPINQLSGTKLSNITVSGVSGLTAADIPANITASNYLPLSGGTIMGALIVSTTTATSTISGTLVVLATSTLSGLQLSGANCTQFNNGGKLTTDASGNVVCGNDTSGSGSGTPGGSNTYVQFNDAGSFGGNAGFAYDKTANRATLAFASTTAISTTYASSTNLFAGILTLSSALTAPNGGTGLSSVSPAGVLVGNYAGTGYQQLATSSLGLLTTNVAEGSNLYYTLSRFAGALAGTTTDALTQGSTNKYYSSLLFASDLAGTTTDALHEGAANLYFTNNRVASVIAGTTTNALAEGSTNKYYTDARVGSFLAATTTLPNLTTLANLASVGTITSGTWNGSILGVPYGGTGWGNIAAGAIPYGNGSAALATTTAATAGYVLTYLNGVPTWAATTTFSGALAYSGGNVACNMASGSVFGCLASADWTTFNNKIASTSLSGAEPITYNSSTGVIGFDLTHANSWSGLQQFANASTSLFSAYGPAYFGATATSTFGTDGSLTLAGALTANGNTTLTNATTTSLFVKSTLSSNTSSFGGTATSSFGTNGALTLAQALGVGSGGTGQASFTSGNLLYGSGTGGVQNIATSSLTAGTALSFSGTAGALVGGTSLTINFQAPATSALSIPYASSTALTVSGTGYFGTASTTNLNLSGISNFLLKTVNGVVTAAVAGADYLTAATIFAYPFPNNATSTLVAFNGGLTATNATSTNLFAQNLTASVAYFGATATTTIDAGGNLTVAGTLTANGNTTLTNATTTSLFVKSAFSSPTATLGAVTATSTLAVYGVSSFGATATSTFATDGALTLASALGVSSGGTGQTTFTSGNLLYGSGTSGVQSVATSSLTAGTALSFSGTAGALVGGTSLTINFQAPASSALSIPFASSTALTVSGTGYFGTASTSNLTVSNIQNALLQTNSSGIVSALTTSAALASLITDKTGSAGSLVFSTSPTFTGTAAFANTTNSGTLAVTGLSTLGQASTTLFSAYGPAYFGGTATSTFGTNGALTLASALSISSGGTATTTQVTGGLNYYDGTRITSGTALSFSGTTLGTPLFSATQTSGTSTIASGQGFTVGSSQFVVQQGSGNIGIGTIGPVGQLSLGNPSTDTTLRTYGTTDQGIFNFYQAANFPTTNAFNRSLDIVSASGAGGTRSIIRFLNQESTSGGPTEAMRIDQSGNVMINSASPVSSGLLSVSFTSATNNGIGINNTNAANGTSFISFASNGTGIGSITNNNNTAVAFNTTSDRRIKENISTTTTGLSTLLQIPVEDFNFITDPNKLRVQGFIAQDLYKYYPYAVTTNGDNGIVPLGASSTPWEVDYGRITPLIVQAVQDIANITSTFQQNLIAWLGNVSNGIQRIFAQELDTQKLCVTDGPSDESPLCVTKAQLAALLSQSAAAGFANPTPASPGTSLANPTPTATSTSDATDTINYVATDSAGDAATSTRTEIIIPAAQSDTASTTPK
jgi:hypothetical protein